MSASEGDIEGNEKSFFCLLYTRNQRFCCCFSLLPNLPMFPCHNISRKHTHTDKIVIEQENVRAFRYILYFVCCFSFFVSESADLRDSYRSGKLFCWWWFCSVSSGLRCLKYKYICLYMYLDESDWWVHNADIWWLKLKSCYFKWTKKETREKHILILKKWNK